MLVQKIVSKSNRALLRELVATDFKLRYQGSIIGYAWSLLRPLLLFCILYVVFVKFMRLGNDVPHYPVYLLLGIVLWTFFTEMTSQSLTAIVARGDLIRKIRIPRWIIVLSSSVSALINLALNLLVVTIFMVIGGASISDNAVWLVFVLAEIYMFAVGVSLFLAAAFVKYRDLGPIWEVILQALFYLTPILYPLALIPNETFQKLILLNPMAQAIQDARSAIVTNQTITVGDLYHSWTARFITIGITLVVFVAGVWYFKRESKYFAENI